jgi:hypothetical protein
MIFLIIIFDIPFLQGNMLMFLPSRLNFLSPGVFFQNGKETVSCCNMPMLFFGVVQGRFSKLEQCFKHRFHTCVKKSRM